MNISRLILISILMVMILPGLSSAEDRLTFDDATKAVRQVLQDYYKPLDAKGMIASFQKGIKDNYALIGVDVSQVTFTATGSVESDLQETRKAMEKVGLSPRAQSRAIFNGLKFMFESAGDGGTKIESPFTHFRTLKEMGYDKGGAGIFLDEIKDENGHFVVLETLPGFPTEKMGLQTGDRITMVDGIPVKRLTYTQVADLIRGPIGTEITITYQRPGEGASTQKPHMVTIKRRWLAPNFKSMEAEMLDDGVLYVRIRFLGENMDQELSRILKTHESKSVKKIIFDVRNNGGNLEGGRELAGAFLPKDTILLTRVTGKNREVFRSHGESLPLLPMVFVVNGKSGSPSVLLAEILKDYGKATIVGSDQEWAESVETSSTLTDGSHYSVTSGCYAFPKGQTVFKKSILKPDIMVKGDPYVKVPLKVDRQIQKALEVLKKS